MYKSKENWSLGLRRIKHVNKAVLAKLRWAVTSRQDKIWVHLLKSKYLRGKMFSKFNKRNQSSWFMEGI